nr:uncharacterized protein LOC112289630 isoform X2 [Physcomitrium patens]|eukprot:XP_024390759.1 uncharacterized protein LOC112289630 isoform X2 [Physcomitrella patens]
MTPSLSSRKGFISRTLGKEGALLISAEDQAFISLNREKDNLAVQNEISHPLVSSSSSRARGNVDPKDIMVGDLSIGGWMEKIDALVAEVENHLDGDRHRWRPLQILKAVNGVLYKVLDFSRASSSNDPFQSYMDHALAFGSGTGVLLGIIYMEVCRRLGVKMEGAAVDESFLVWPLLDDSAQMVFEPCKGGKSWMIEDFSQWRSSTSSQQNSISSTVGRVLDISVVRTLESKSNRDILGLILKSLKNVYWRRAVKSRPGLTPDLALQPYMSRSSWAINNAGLPVGAMLRPEDLRLTVMALERLVHLEPRNWALRKEYGMVLYHSRRYDEAVLELSICMALAPLPEEELLQPFVERLHLMRMESTWNIFSSSSSPSAFV